MVRNYSGGDFVPDASECRGTSGIKAEDLPSEETIPDCDGTKARRMELDVEERLTGRVEFDDGEKLIITFENSNKEEQT